MTHSYEFTKILKAFVTDKTGVLEEALQDPFSTKLHIASTTAGEVAVEKDLQDSVDKLYTISASLEQAEALARTLGEPSVIFSSDLPNNIILNEVFVKMASLLEVQLQDIEQLQLSLSSSLTGENKEIFDEAKEESLSAYAELVLDNKIRAERAAKEMSQWQNKLKASRIENFCTSSVSISYLPKNEIPGFEQRQKDLGDRVRKEIFELPALEQAIDKKWTSTYTDSAENPSTTLSETMSKKAKFAHAGAKEAKSRQNEISLLCQDLEKFGTDLLSVNPWKSGLGAMVGQRVDTISPSSSHQVELADKDCKANATLVNRLEAIKAKAREERRVLTEFYGLKLFAVDDLLRLICKLGEMLPSTSVEATSLVVQARSTLLAIKDKVVACAEEKIALLEEAKNLTEISSTSQLPVRAEAARNNFDQSESLVDVIDLSVYKKAMPDIEAELQAMLEEEYQLPNKNISYLERLLSDLATKLEEELASSKNTLAAMSAYLAELVNVKEAIVQQRIAEPSLKIASARLRAILSLRQEILANEIVKSETCLRSLTTVKGDTKDYVLPMRLARIITFKTQTALIIEKDITEQIAKLDRAVGVKASEAFLRELGQELSLKKKEKATSLVILRSFLSNERKIASSIPSFSEATLTKVVRSYERVLYLEAECADKNLRNAMRKLPLGDASLPSVKAFTKLVEAARKTQVPAIKDIEAAASLVGLRIQAHSLKLLRQEKLFSTLHSMESDAELPVEELETHPLVERLAALEALIHASIASKMRRASQSVPVLERTDPTFVAASLLGTKGSSSEGPNNTYSSLSLSLPLEELKDFGPEVSLALAITPQTKLEIEMREALVELAVEAKDALNKKVARIRGNKLKAVKGNLKAINKKQVSKRAAEARLSGTVLVEGNTRIEIKLQDFVFVQIKMYREALTGSLKTKKLSLSSLEEVRTQEQIYNLVAQIEAAERTIEEVDYKVESLLVTLGKLKELVKAREKIVKDREKVADKAVRDRKMIASLARDVSTRPESADPEFEQTLNGIIDLETSAALIGFRTPRSYSSPRQS
jgi:hypothetical protein